MKRCVALVMMVVVGMMMMGCGSAKTSNSGGRIVAVGAENQYADVIRQVGGSYVEVSSILNNPSTDPHTFEASPSIARTISNAALIVENGLGYDSFMGQLVQASRNDSRRVITVQKLLGITDEATNPHLWYRPDAMVKVASAVAEELSKLDPKHADEFRANAAAFEKEIGFVTSAIAKLKKDHPGAAVVVTEPVADYLIEAAGLRNVTPKAFQDAVMKGADPSPQDVAAMQQVFKKRGAKAFLYNQQVTDSLTASFVDLAHKNRVPVVGVYETMPTPEYTYQLWMLAEVKAIQRALTTGESTEKL